MNDEERAKMVDSVYRKGIESLCIYYRFLSRDPEVACPGLRPVLVGQDSRNRAIPVLRDHAKEPPHTIKTPKELEKLRVHDLNGEGVYDKAEFCNASMFARMIRKDAVVLPS